MAVCVVALCLMGLAAAAGVEELASAEVAPSAGVAALEAKLKAMRKPEVETSWKRAKKDLPVPKPDLSKYHTGPSKATIREDMQELKVLESERKGEPKQQKTPTSELGDAKEAIKMHPKAPAVNMPSKKEIDNTVAAAMAHAKKLESEGKLTLNQKAYKQAGKDYRNTMAAATVLSISFLLGMLTAGALGCILIAC